MARSIALAAILAVGVLCTYNTYVAGPLPDGGWGMKSAPASSDLRVQRVTLVVPGGPAARAGLAAGDIIRAIVPHVFILDWPFPGERIAIEVSRGSVKRIVPMVAKPYYNRRYATEVILYASEIAGVLLAALLAWRRWTDPVARALIFFLVLQATTLSDGNLPGYTYGYIRSLQTLAIFLSYAALTRFAAIYPAELRSARVRRQFALWMPAVTVAIGAAFAFDQFAREWLNRAGPLNAVEYRYASLLCANVVPLVGFVLGALAAPAADRRRLVVFIGFFLAGITGPITYNIILAVTTLNTLAVRPLLATLVLMNAGFVYMILRHRMFDIGFVLNRAAIYAVLTTVFVPLFALLEWVAERYLASQNRTESLLLQVGIALVLFISLRRVHAYAEGFVDRWLFRERHENETALNDFARHVVFITDEHTITERTAEIVCARTEASWSAVYLRDDRSGRCTLSSRCGDPALPIDVSENDPVVVAMRADRMPVEHPAASALSEALALPLFARGRLTGFLACGSKRSGESYAPDERDALMQVAHAVASALEGVRLTKLEEKIARYEGVGRLRTQP
jgi:hypothetical protein